MTNKFRNCPKPVVRDKLTVPAGDYIEFDVAVVNTGGAPYDLTGATVTFYAANSLDNPTVTLLKDNAGTGGVIVMDPTNGRARVVLESADTLIMGADGGFMFYEIKVEDASLRLFTVASGSILFVNDLL